MDTKTGFLADEDSQDTLQVAVKEELDLSPPPTDFMQKLDEAFSATTDLLFGTDDQ